MVVCGAIINTVHEIESRIYKTEVSSHKQCRYYTIQYFILRLGLLTLVTMLSIVRKHISRSCLVFPGTSIHFYGLLNGRLVDSRQRKGLRHNSH